MLFSTFFGLFVDYGFIKQGESLGEVDSGLDSETET